MGDRRSAPPAEASDSALAGSSPDSLVVRLLRGLGAPRFPRPADVAETDGELAAHYAAGPRTLPPRGVTPAPLPPVVVNITTRLPAIVDHELDATVRMARPPMMTTIVTRPRSARRWMLVGTVTASCLVAGAMVTAVHVRRPAAAASSLRPPSNQTAPAPLAPAVSAESAEPPRATATAAQPSMSASSRRPIPTPRPWHAPPAAPLPGSSKMDREP